MTMTTNYSYMQVHFSKLVKVDEDENEHIKDWNLKINRLTQLTKYLWEKQPVTEFKYIWSYSAENEDSIEKLKQVERKLTLWHTISETPKHKHGNNTTIVYSCNTWSLSKAHRRKTATCGMKDVWEMLSTSPEEIEWDVIWIVIEHHALNTSNGKNKVVLPSYENGAWTTSTDWLRWWSVFKALVLALSLILAMSLALGMCH